MPASSPPDPAPVLSVPEVDRLADAIEPRYRALLLLATFGNLRWGRAGGLRDTVPTQPGSRSAM